MRPLRFLTLFVIAYLLGLGVGYFFLFSAQYLQQANVLFGGVIFVVFLTLFFSWLYFRGVPNLDWRHRWEAIGVWLGLSILTDIINTLAIQQAPLESMLSLYLLGGYGLQFLALFVAAYITSGGNHPRLSSPNLALPTENDA